MHIKFSIIIPSYNEGVDVRLSIQSALNQSYPPTEVIVVDDSDDGITPEIIKGYKSYGVQLVKGPGIGCCDARNLGIKMATSDVVILLNADVILPSDFLEKLVYHYKNGADYVLVESRVQNIENLFARFIDAQGKELYGKRDDIEWAEGFSCRRNAAVEVGLIPGNFPARFCRDWMLGKQLNDAGFKKIIDRSIVVFHKSPDNFQEYWRVRKDRGRFVILCQYFIFNRSFTYLVFKLFAKNGLLFFKYVTLLPLLIRVFKISLFSPKFLFDFFKIGYAYILQELARCVGEWQGLIFLRENM